MISISARVKDGFAFSRCGRRDVARDVDAEGIGKVNDPEVFPFERWDGDLVDVVSARGDAWKCPLLGPVNQGDWPPSPHPLAWSALRTGRAGNVACGVEVEFPGATPDHLPVKA